ncbi:hypothetical protein Bca101_024644 [Brassica carinata]
MSTRLNIFYCDLGQNWRKSAQLQIKTISLSHHERCSLTERVMEDMEASFMEEAGMVAFHGGRSGV